MQLGLIVSIISLLNLVSGGRLHLNTSGLAASLLQRESASQTEAVAVHALRLWGFQLVSNPHEDLSDPYAPEHKGSPTLSAYCKKGHSIDPACRADGEKVELVDEIAQVKKHMRCMMKPETCPGGIPAAESHAPHGGTDVKGSTSDSHAGNAGGHSGAGSGSSGASSDSSGSSSSGSSASPGKSVSSGSGAGGGSTGGSSAGGSTASDHGTATSGHGDSAGSGAGHNEGGHADVGGGSSADSSAGSQSGSSAGAIGGSASSTDTTRGGAAGNAGKVNEATREEAKFAHQDIEKKVVRLAKLKQDLEDEGELDAELGRAMTGVIESSEVFAGTLEEVSDGEVADADAALTEVEAKAAKVDVAAFDLETGVHPHGHKWWRFRWEYSLVEAIMLMFLIILVIFTHACISKGQSTTSQFMPTKMVGFSSMINLYNIVFNSCLKEFAVLGVTQGIIWIMNQMGFFDWILGVLPVNEIKEQMVLTQTNRALSLQQFAAGFVMHLPNSGADLVYTLRCVNMHLFLGIGLYFLLMYHVVFAAVHIFSMFLQAEDDVGFAHYQAELNTEDFLMGSASVGAVRRSDEATPRSETSSTTSHPAHATSSTWLSWVAGCLDKAEDYQNIRRYFINHVLLREDLCQDIVKGVGLGDQVELEDALHRIYLYRYLSVHIRRRLMDMIVIDFRVWLALVLVFVGDILLHLYAHVAFVELLPVYIGLAFTIQVWQIFHARTQLKYMVSAEGSRADKATDAQRQGNSFAQHHRIDLLAIRVQQLILLLICYSGARLLASKFFWTDYFELTCLISFVLVFLYIFHVFVGSIWITLYMIVYTLPPYINDDEKVALIETIIEAKSFSKEIKMVPGRRLSVPF